MGISEEQAREQLRQRQEQERQIAEQREADRRRAAGETADDDNPLAVAAENPGEPARPYVPGDSGYPTSTEHGKPGTGKKQAREMSRRTEAERAQKP